MEGFTTLVDISIEGDENGFPNGSGGRAEIKWKCEFVLGDKSDSPLSPQFFGIKGMVITVPDQSVSFISTFYNEETDEETEKEVTIELKNVKVHNDLGSCTIDSFNLLPVELKIHKDNYELMFV